MPGMLHAYCLALVMLGVKACHKAEQIRQFCPAPSRVTHVSTDVPELSILSEC